MKVSTHLLNPIGIIALFAALCEASATTVLPYLDNDNRQIYIWFLIVFPSALVVMFFLTLNFNSTVLYGPHENTTIQPPPPLTPNNEERDHATHDRQPE
ncbi:Uncharacterised protein [Paucimonas lemoignei]|jgi:hypothetical protein|nr:Uncharacterised protein [Paucimonas lemoignei]